jgi:hypothetical protein
MNVEKYFPHFVTLTLLVLGAFYRSAALGYASVVALGLVMVKDVLERIATEKLAKMDGVEDVKKLVQQVNARVATLEYGVKTRGF